jgi:DNA-binding LytR/AlgR family response regulator
MAMKITVMIVEDEPLAREGLKNYLLELEEFQLIAVCENALEANKVLQEKQPDLMFLDIQMPKLTGIDFLKTLVKPPLVIFTTAYPHYALEGYELNVVDYLVKPYPFDRFLKAVNKVKEKLATREAPFSQETDRDYLYVKTNQMLRRINFLDILLIEGMENYVTIYTREEKLISLMTMKSLEDSLPSSQFLRVHKTYIIAKRKVLGIVGNELDMGVKKVPISRVRRNEILHELIGKM